MRRSAGAPGYARLPRKARAGQVAGNATTANALQNKHPDNPLPGHADTLPKGSPAAGIGPGEFPSRNNKAPGPPWPAN